MDFSNYECNDQMSIFDVIRQPFKIDKSIRLIELFAGVGSQAMALRDLGASFQHHRVVEFDKFAVASYNAIHDTNFSTLDIRQVKGSDLGIIETDKYCYILTYSFPCQDLSVAGKQRGMTKGSGTRSGLLWEVERLLNETEHLPQVLLMENVPQVISDANIKDFQLWQDFLTSKGYSNYVEILNAKDFGVAQNRERCFMVSILGDYNYKFPKPIPLTKKIKDYLEDNVEEKYYINNEKSNMLITQLLENGTLQSGMSGNIPCKLDKPYEDGKFASMKDGISFRDLGTNTAGTITARYYKGLGSNGDNAIIVASRGRNPGNPSDRTPGNHVEQRLEVNSQGLCNTITSVQKDNMVLETVAVKQATSKGYEECVIGGVADLSFPSSKTRRGRVQDGGNTCPTLTAETTGVCRIESLYRIRKLIPLECWRLMDFTDDDFHKAESVNSNSQLYKQAGNSIVKAVLMDIFKQML